MVQKKHMLISTALHIAVVGGALLLVAFTSRHSESPPDDLPPETVDKQLEPKMSEVIAESDWISEEELAAVRELAEFQQPQALPSALQAAVEGAPPAAKAVAAGRSQEAGADNVGEVQQVTFAEPIAGGQDGGDSGVSPSPSPSPSTSSTSPPPATGPTLVQRIDYSAATTGPPSNRSTSGDATKSAAEEMEPSQPESSTPKDAGNSLSSQDASQALPAGGKAAGPKGYYAPSFKFQRVSRAQVDWLVRSGRAKIAALRQENIVILMTGGLAAPDSRLVESENDLQDLSERALPLPKDCGDEVRAHLARTAHRDHDGTKLNGTALELRLVLTSGFDVELLQKQLRALENVRLKPEEVAETIGEFLADGRGGWEYRISAIRSFHGDLVKLASPVGSTPPSGLRNRPPPASKPRG